MAKTERLYSIWRHMRDRCYNPNNAWFHLYGGKGITICDEWSDYHTFKKWALANGYADNLSIDRIDGNKGYCPDNCRFADAITQSNNTSRNVFIEYKGKRQTIAQWEREMGFPRHFLQKRLKKGWTVEAAFETPSLSMEDRRDKETGRMLAVVM